MKKLLLPLLVCAPVATVATSCTPNPDTNEPYFMVKENYVTRSTKSGRVSFVAKNLIRENGGF